MGEGSEGGQIKFLERGDAQGGMRKGVRDGGGVGHDYDAQTCGGGSLVARHRILERDRVVDAQAEMAERGEVNVGRGFAAGHIFAANDGGEAIQQTACGEVALHMWM